MSKFQHLLIQQLVRANNTFHRQSQLPLRITMLRVVRSKGMSEIKPYWIIYVYVVIDVPKKYIEHIQYTILMCCVRIIIIPRPFQSESPFANIFWQSHCNEDFSSSHLDSFRSKKKEGVRKGVRKFYGAWKVPRAIKNEN